jgi:plasmid maintenance system antidote protein VapI
MAVRPEPTGGQFVDATGSIRRVRALHAIGHTALVIADAAQTHRSRILPLLDGYPRLRRSLAIRIESAYSQLAERPGDNARARNRSRRERWAPPICWNDDTIDDPNAHPDWTGHCGTDRGWWLHSNEGIPACVRCETAHAAWLADRKHLAAAERFRQLALAKGAASQRGANLAADARELMRVCGLSYEQAAERLGVTRNHLQQELIRHPETREAAA